jgi:formamidopyrimidine-DNA glycosylase
MNHPRADRSLILFCSTLRLMPELPDITAYLEALETRILGARIEHVRVLNPFLLRTAEPALASVEGKQVVGLQRIGKRIVIELEQELFLVAHLMIAGRLHWLKPGAKAGGRNVLAVFELSTGTMTLTEAGTKRRAALHLVRGQAALRALDPGGIDVMSAEFAQFSQRLQRENHTLKRSLTDPHLFSGIGNAYSDEILHRAQLSPLAMSAQLSQTDSKRLYEAARAVLREWIDRLRAEAASGFPEKVTAFRDAMAVHGKFGQPCPVCGAPVQRIVYAENEVNYCARCQTGGKVLADRALSRLLKKSWPRSIDELE